MTESEKNTETRQIVFANQSPAAEPTSEMTIRRIERSASITPHWERVAAYCRVSTGKDAMLHSLSAQVSYYNELIQRHPGWRFAGVYADLPYTGTKDSRPEFQRMLADAKEGCIDRIITKSISRFARNTVTLLKTVRDLGALGVAVSFEEQNIDSMSGDGELMLTILASFAQEESRSVSDNCKWRIRKDFSEGKPMNLMLLYGYRSIEGRIEIDPHEAEVIRDIFRQYLQGDGSVTIAARLREEQIPCRLGGEWSSRSVLEILGNEKYTGDALLQKTYTENHLTKKTLQNRGQLTQYYAEATHPAIISHATFAQAQKRLEQNRIQNNVKKPTDARYPLTGKIICGHCGAHYNRRTRSHGENAVTITWQCMTYSRKGKRYCPAKQVPEDKLLAITCEVLGVDAITNETLAPLESITALDGNRLLFSLKDGSTAERIWQDRSRAESWTDGMKQKASTQMKMEHIKRKERRHEHE